MVKNVNGYSSADSRFDEIRVRENDRQAAPARDADVVAEMFARAVDNLRLGREALADSFPHLAR